MVNKLTSIKTVISKVVRDFGLNDQEVRWQDMIEWISEGLILIGSYYQFQEKEAIIAVEDYKGVLPCDFYKSIKYLDGCNLGDNFQGPYWDLTNKLLEEAGYKETNPEGTVEEGNTMKITDMYSFQKLQLVQYNKTGNINNFFGTLQRVDSNLIGAGLTYTGLGNSYSVNFDTITTTFRYGYIALRYLAIPVDADGYPMVPDHPSFLEALMWRCAAKLAQRGHTFKNPTFNDFEVGNFYWNNYCMQARGEANAPDPDMMQRLANIWTNLLPNYDEYYSDFNALGQRNTLDLDGRW